MKEDKFSILIIGDIFGKPGRATLKRYLPVVREIVEPDVIIVNAENAAHGYGIRPNMVKELLDMGVDVITTGNHVWDHKDIIGTFNEEPRILRPANYPRVQPGRGIYDLTLKGSKGEYKPRIIRVINLAGRIAMGSADCPFVAVDQWVGQGNPQAQGLTAIVVDLHAEATSEKVAMGFHLDGRCTAVVGTHTHIPTADHRVLPKGTGLMSDLGMTGNYTSIIGMNIEQGLNRFLGRVPRHRGEPEAGNGMMCGVLVDVDMTSGLCKNMTPIRIGDGLSVSDPRFAQQRHEANAF